jgi:hypothetical protein
MELAKEIVLRRIEEEEDDTKRKVLQLLVNPFL